MILNSRTEVILIKKILLKYNKKISTRYCIAKKKCKNSFTCNIIRYPNKKLLFKMTILEETKTGLLAHLIF